LIKRFAVPFDFPFSRHGWASISHRALKALHTWMAGPVFGDDFWGKIRGIP